MICINEIWKLDCWRHASEVRVQWFSLLESHDQHNHAVPYLEDSLE